MNTIFSIAFMVSFSAGSAYAQECVQIENDLDRLACYDVLHKRMPVVTELNKPDEGNWLVFSKKSEFRDTEDFFMSVESDDTLGCKQFGAAEKARLMLRCMENTTSLMLITSCHVASGFKGYGKVEYRLDDQKSQTRSFQESTDNSTLGLWNGGKSIPVIKQMLGKDELLVRFTPFNQSPVTAKFDISGIDGQIKPLREACHW